MRKVKGYTLIELLVALSLFILILVGGTTLFTQNLRSGGLTEVDLNLTGSMRSILDQFERTLRFSKVLTVDTVDRDACLNFGSSGYTGSSIEVEDLTGMVSTYSLDQNKIASTSAETGEKTYINSSTVSVNTLVIKWYCQSGINDKINLEINASSTSLGSGITITRSMSRDLVLLNGSIN